jgi:hypothetical protein
MFILNGKPLSPDVAFTTGGIKYPVNFLRLSTLEEKEAIGITEQADPIQCGTSVSGATGIDGLPGKTTLNS